MKYKDMSWIGKLFHSHVWTLPGRKLECEECGFVPTCKEHGETLYIHGWDEKIDCTECKKKLRPKL
jgi:hypothetical protein